MSESLAADREFVRTTAPNVSWQSAMKLAIRSADELYARLDLPGIPARLTANAAESDFPLFVPLEFVRRMRPGDPDDPLLRQVLPVAEESAIAPGFGRDPVGEISGPGGPATTTGVLRKYRGRALLIAHQACGIHCRYCFRRHFPYAAIEPPVRAWDGAIAQLVADPTVDEVILSGGDPLVLTDPALRRLIDALAHVPHLRRLRIHSRMPVVIPQRVTDELVAMLRETRLATWLVIHANHPAELDAATIDALGRLVDAGIPVLNQSVLLSGVNDDPLVMEQLCRQLVNARIQPYYLHQLDRVAGAAHFEVEVDRGLRIMGHLREHLPGYAVPKYVREEAGAPSKTPLD